MTDSHKEWITNITTAYRHEIIDALKELGYAVMTEENRAASAANLATMEAELAAANAKVAELTKMAYKLSWE